MRLSGGLVLSCAVLMLTLLPAIGCGGSDSVTVPTSPLVIYTQPKDASVPMGLTAAFSVGASGTGLQYQWFRDGVAIAGANGSSYTTPATLFSDDGEGFSVEVRDGSEAVRSVVAHLAVTARAPLAGDLRFQQVDAPLTVNGYQVAQWPWGTPSTLGCPVPGGGGSGVSVTGPMMPFRLTNAWCTWNVAASAPLKGLSDVQSVMAVTYLSQFASDISQPSITNWPSGSDPQSVIVSASVPSVEPTVIGYGYVHGNGTQAFSMQQGTVDATSFAAATSQEGARGHVITAMYVIGANITYFSYGWVGDPSSVYETKVVTGTLDQVGAMIQGLAGEGYIVTATTSAQNDDGSGIWVVGTRLRGDYLARPVMVVAPDDLSKLTAGGYAVVASTLKNVNGQPAAIQFVGER